MVVYHTGEQQHTCQTQSCPQLPRFAGCLVDYQCATTSTTALRCIGKLRLVVAEDLQTDALEQQ